MCKAFIEALDGAVEPFFDGRIPHKIFEDYLKTLPSDEQEKQRMRAINITKTLMKTHGYNHAFYLSKQVIHMFYNPKFTIEPGITEEEYIQIIKKIDGESQL